MNNYNVIEFEFPLDDLAKYFGAILHFQYWSEDDAVTKLELSDDFLGMAVNLSPHAQRYRFGEISGTLGRSQFNFFFIPKHECQLSIPEGLTSVLFIKCNSDFLEQFQSETDLIAPFLNHARFGRAAAMNPKNHPMSYEMLDDVTQLMRQGDLKGVFRDFFLRAKAGNMILAGILTSHEQYLKGLDDTDVLTMQDVYEYLVKNLKFIQHVSTLANLVNTTEKSFRVRFKAVFGKPIQEVLKRERLKKAEHLLRFTNMAINQIGEEVGYSAASSFVDAFKDQFGVYPTEFRERYGSKESKE